MGPILAKKRADLQRVGYCTASQTWNNKAHANSTLCASSASSSLFILVLPPSAVSFLLRTRRNRIRGSREQKRKRDGKRERESPRAHRQNAAAVYLESAVLGIPWGGPAQLSTTFFAFFPKPFRTSYFFNLLSLPHSSGLAYQSPLNRFPYGT